MFQHIIWEPDAGAPGVATIMINRPGRRNAVSADTARELTRAWEMFEASTARVAVISGAGEAAFSSGADLDDPPRNVPCLPGAAVRLTKPVISAVSGWCLGLGLVLSQMADLCVADSTAKFGLPEVRIGKTGGSIFALLHRLPLKCASELILGEYVSAERAREMGMVNWVVEPGQHVDRALEVAAHIASYDADTVHWLKGMMTELVPKSPGEHAEALTSFMQHTLDGPRT